VIESILIIGLVNGGTYAILAVGFSLIFGVARILNVAHTAFYMITAFLIYIATGILGFPIYPSVILAILITSLWGMVSYKLFFDRIKEHETAVMIIAIALAMLFQEIFLIAFGAPFNRIAPFIPGFLEIAGIRVLFQHIIAVGISLITLFCLWILLSKTKLGIKIRAIAQDREIANLMGINVGWVCMTTMGISVVLAGVSAAAVAPILGVNPYMWIHPLIIVLAAVVLGGLGSIKGSIAAAFILGFAETTVVFLIPGGAFLRGAVSLSIMVIVLLVRPEGLFGVFFEEERV